MSYKAYHSTIDQIQRITDVIERSLDTSQEFNGVHHQKLEYKLVNGNWSIFQSCYYMMKISPEYCMHMRDDIDYRYHSDIHKQILFNLRLS